MDIGFTTAVHKRSVYLGLNMVVKPDREAELEAMARVLDALADQLRGMMRDGDSPIREKKEETGGFEVGKRVRIVARGKCYGRTAVLLSRRGRLYWNIRVEEEDGGVARELYKAETSLRVIEA